MFKDFTFYDLLVIMFKNLIQFSQFDLYYKMSNNYLDLIKRKMATMENDFKMLKSSY